MSPSPSQEQVELMDIALMLMVVYLGSGIDKMEIEWKRICGSRTSPKGILSRQGLSPVDRVRLLTIDRQRSVGQ